MAFMSQDWAIPENIHTLYLYHGRLFGFPKERGGSEGMGRYLRLEIRRHGGIPQVGFLEKKVYIEFLEKSLWTFLVRI